MKKEDLKEALEKSLVNIKFTKLDGSERNMTCTQSLNIIPEDCHPEGIMTNDNDNIFRVFDVQEEDWRSFRFDTVISVAVI